MKKRKQIVSILAGIMAAVMLLTMILSLLPTKASATSSSEIRKQINELQEDKKEIQKKIEEVKAQYQENEDEIADIIARKNVIEQEIQLLSTQITNINEQISAYNTLIADKQDELDDALEVYREMSKDNRVRVRTMEEEGELSYWEVLFKANSFSDLLDRLNMVEEIAAADNRHLKELSDAADAVAVAQTELEEEKAGMEATKQELDDTQAEMDAKREEAIELFQELLEKADDLDALKAEYEAQEQEFLDQIAAKEVEYSQAKQREWEAFMATYVPPTKAEGGTTGNTGNTGNVGSTGNSGGNAGGSGSWLVPVSYTSITSPFGNRTSPTAGASSYHQGIDLDTGTGDPVYATRAGFVTTASYSNSAGNYVTINHQDGFSSVYMHLSSYCVSPGTYVEAGKVIGKTGATGIATGDHLHFGISYNGVYVNPANYVNLH